jgi:purine-binding chemotaxis protein CheW
VSLPPAKVGATRLVIFRLDEQRYAIALEQVDRVLSRVALARFPQAPDIVDGIFDLHGELIPAVNVRKRFRMGERMPALSDQMIVVQTPRRRLAFLVDAVEAVTSVSPGEIAAPEMLVPGLGHVRGIMRLPGDGIVFIHDVDTFLSLEEEAHLCVALEGTTG